MAWSTGLKSEMLCLVGTPHFTCYTFSDIGLDKYDSHVVKDRKSDDHSCDRKQLKSTKN